MLKGDSRNPKYLLYMVALRLEFKSSRLQCAVSSVVFLFCVYANSRGRRAKVTVKIPFPYFLK